MVVPQPRGPEFRRYTIVQATTEAELRRILEATAKAIQRRIASLPVGIGGEVRAAQLRVTLAAINALVQTMWVRRINPLVERAIKDSLQAAEDAIETLERIAYAGLSERAADALVASLRAAGASGLKSDAARRARALSRRVYSNRALDDGRIVDIIRQGLIQNLSAKELAAKVYRYVSPTAPGGSSYSAMRLARTEINNAFHERQKEGANRPGVKAVKWNLSGSHKVPDECNVFAAHEPYDPDEVPDKPHPNCFCYLTYVMMSSDDFKKALERGDFDDELTRRTQENLARLGQPVGDVTPVSVSTWDSDAGLKRLAKYKDGDQLDASTVGIKDLFDSLSPRDAKVPPSEIRKKGPIEEIDLSGRVLLSHQDKASVSRIRHYLKEGIPGGDDNLPNLTILPSGAIVIKDGNHRIIASLLARRTWVRAHVHRVES